MIDENLLIKFRRRISLKIDRLLIIRYWIRDNEIKASYHVLWCSKYKKNSTYIIRIFIKDVQWKLESSFHFSML